MDIVNIVILTCGKLEATKQCLEALYSYTKDFNLLIVDNGSPINMLQYLEEENKKCNNMVVHYNKENEGVILGRNRGYEISKAIFPGASCTIFLDDDQYVKEDWFENHFSFLEKDYDIVGVEAWKLRRDFYPHKKVIKSTDTFNYVGCGGMLIRNEVIEDIGLFDERFNPMYFEDPNFCWNAYEAGYRIGWNYNTIVRHQPHKLLNEERRVYFNNSWRQFCNIWRDKKPYEFCMGEGG